MDKCTGIVRYPITARWTGSRRYDRPIPGTGLTLPAWSGLGDVLMLISALMSGLSALGFRLLKQRIERSR